MTAWLLMLALLGADGGEEGATAPVSSDAGVPTLDVSVMQLITRPELYEGKRVRVIGYAVTEFQEVAVFFHKEDFQVANRTNALWVQADRQYPRKQGWVVVEGTFDSSIKGRKDAYPGALKDVTRFELWKP
ncbi:MAG: hypothetical protein U0228_33125 [Myxococcaceae bacterium]